MNANHIPTDLIRVVPRRGGGKRQHMVEQHTPTAPPRQPTPAVTWLIVGLLAGLLGVAVLVGGFMVLRSIDRDETQRQQNIIRFLYR